VEPNKRGYVLRHGYAYIDASSSLDPSRPPSWSKILAVRKHLPDFDWVFWNDVVSDDASWDDASAADCLLLGM
jgi:mannan polymerase II complex MNN10 subunit